MEPLDDAAKEKPRLRYLGSKKLFLDGSKGVYKGKTIPDSDLAVRVNGGRQVSVAYYRHLSGNLDEKFAKGAISIVPLGAGHVIIPFDETRDGQVYARARYYK